ncbi:hypothetical protein [Pedobacter zeae]|uniref:Uncharacterized protein n=1 Tax=Pedobacter zeae TaxID=1737356 RepID=A0A7W6KAR5_9SPHI|nr:hypothetical protein [Pedobacter zeae]MBB4108328.1 hypothetical protein [Pedobacter zeae]GGG93510.1 hypothetical protein GCM10007422_03450 [Pedobacter zeae]
MTYQQNNTSIKQDPRFTGVDHHCLLPGASIIKCDHWGCKVTAKQPQYYPGWKKFFSDRGTTRFHIHRRDFSQLSADQLKNVPADINPDLAWLTPMPKGDGDKPNLNTGWIVEAEGYWPDRSIYNADEVDFIHVEYQTMRAKQNDETKAIIATQDVNSLNYHEMLTEQVMDVKEVAIFVGKEVVNG